MRTRLSLFLKCVAVCGALAPVLPACRTAGQAASPAPTAEVVVSARDWTTGITVPVGTRIRAPRPATYDEWTVHVSNDVLRPLDSPERQRRPGVDGWRFEAAHPGTAEVVVTPFVGSAPGPSQPRFTLKATVTARGEDERDERDADGAARYRWLKYRDASNRIPRGGFARAAQHVASMQAAPSATAAAPSETAGLSRNAWRFLGPGNVGGRVRALVIDPADPSRMLAGSAGGGIWLTTDGGASWSAVDDFLPSLAVSALAYNPANPNEMYAASGEGFFNSDAIAGAGIYKSTDRGATWSPLPSSSSILDLTRIAVSHDGNTILVAGATGMFRSTDHGASFAAVGTLARATQVVFHPTDSNKALAGFATDGVEYTTDGGKTWHPSTGFFSTVGRVEVAYAPSQPAIVYASVDDPSHPGLYKSVDGGVTFTQVSTLNVLGNQGWYDNAIWVNPQDPNDVVVGGVLLWESRDGGASWRTLFDDTEMHVDFHAIVQPPTFDAADNSTRAVFVGCDGGVYEIPDVFDTTSPSASSLDNNLGVTQFYAGGGDAATGVMAGGTQDNGTVLYDPAQKTWSALAGGDGGVVAFDTTRPGTIYLERQYLQLVRKDPGSDLLRAIYGPLPDALTAALFVAPFVLDPHDQQRMLAGGRSLWRTDDATVNPPAWTQILGPDTLGNYISTISIWPGSSDIIWVGRSFGGLWKTTNGTAASPTWTKLPLDVQMFESRILLDPADSKIAYVATGSWGSSNIRKTIDGGATWSVATGSGATALPAAPVNDLEMDPSDRNTIYAATEIGVFVSADGGATWQVPNAAPANVAVDDLFWMGTTLVAATHGRGMFAIDVGGSSGTPAITASPARVDFGSRAVSTTSAAQSIAIKNAGSAPLTIQTVTIAGAQAGDFSVASTTCTGASVAPGATCSINTTFHPTATGARAADVSIASNAPGSPTLVPLVGTGISSQSGGTIVLWTADVPAADVHGDWQRVSDPTAAGGAALRNPDRGRAKVAPGLASPTSYFDVTFTASRATAYHIWVRLKADDDSLHNDSVHLQFSDAVTAAGNPTERIGTTSSAEFVLQDGYADASANHAWGWTDNGWGELGASIYFAATGTHTLRVQQREDGTAVDQIVLSPDTYVSSPPGPRDNDTTILPSTTGPPPPPPSDETIVLWTANVPAADVHGDWQRVSDATAAGGAALRNPDRGRAKVAPALASPTSYFDVTFTASRATAYHIWVRLRADNDSLHNDSVHLQFSDAVSVSGNPTARIGTTSSAELVLPNGYGDTSANHAWGWTDNGWGAPGTPIYFAATGTHTVRVQQREDGATVDQIVLSPDTYASTPPGPRDNDTTILAPTTGVTASSATVVVWTANVPTADVHGDWQRVSDSTAAGGAALRNPDRGRAKVAPALASPTSYVDVTFTASAGTPYHIWVRLKADNDSLHNDSVHIQFSDAVTGSGDPTTRIGTTSSAELVLQNGYADTSANHAWGWTDNGWGELGTPIYFAATGTHTLRIQQREDGASVDQIVLSPDTFWSTPPGPRDNDTTILPARGGSD